MDVRAKSYRRTHLQRNWCKDTRLDCALTQGMSHVHDSLLCVTWLMGMCDMIHWYKWLTHIDQLSFHRSCSNSAIPNISILSIRVTHSENFVHFEASMGSFKCVPWHIRKMWHIWGVGSGVCLRNLPPSHDYVCHISSSLMYVSLNNRIYICNVLNTLQHTATHCNTRQHTARHGSIWIAVAYALHWVLCNTRQDTATDDCNRWLQHTARDCNKWIVLAYASHSPYYTTLHDTATHCDTLQHTATRCTTLQYTTIQCHTVQHTSTHCNTLQHTAAHCNTLQHAAPHCTTQHNYASTTTFRAH